jgi:LPS sulfotransferase NodH
MGGLELSTEARAPVLPAGVGQAGPAVSYAICTNPRSGSWLLSEGLGSTTVAGNPREWFHHSEEAKLRDRWREEFPGGLNYEIYLEKVLDFAATPNKIFGVKLHYYQFMELPAKMAEVERFRGLTTPALLSAMFPNLHYVWLTRRDKARQALSYYRATKTAEWWQIADRTDGPAPAPELDLPTVAKREAELVENDAQWRRYFRANAIEPYVVTYEELAADYEGTIVRLLSWLGVPDAQAVEIPPTRLKKQSDEVTESWLPAYLRYRSGSRDAPERPQAQPAAAAPQQPQAVGAGPAGTAPAPRVAAAGLPDAWKTWIGANRLLGVSQAAMVDTIARNGFDREAAAAEVARSARDPYLLVSENSQQRLNKATALMTVLDGLKALNSQAGTVERRSGLSRREFIDEYYSLNRPVLLDGLMNDWPAMDRWTPDYLKSRVGDEIVEVMAERNADPLFERNSSKHRREMRFGDYVDRVYSGEVTNEYYLVANNGFFQRQTVRSLLDDIRLFPEYLTGDASQGVFLWFGPAGTLTPLHHDTSNIFMAQVSGRKHVKMVPASQWQYVYNSVGVFSDVDPDNPDFARFPEFRKATVIDVILEPGEVLFMPIGWWHHVRALDPSIMVSFTNFAFRNHFDWPS